nr:hypothetical protein CFP56_03902 [Quercus suber]
MCLGTLTIVVRQNIPPFQDSPSPSFDRNLSVPTPPESDLTPPGCTLTPLGRRHRRSAPCSSPILTARPLSPSARNPLLEDQRDHSACGKKKLVLGVSCGDGSPLRVRKTRENLRDGVAVHDSSFAHPLPVPVPRCACTLRHGAQSDETAVQLTDMSGLSDTTTLVAPGRTQVQMRSQSMLQRHKSASRRMLSRVKSSVVGASRTQSVGQMSDGITESTGLLRKLSSRRKQRVELDGSSTARAADSIDSAIQPYVEGDEVVEIHRESEEIPTRSFTGSTYSSSGMPSTSPPDQISDGVTLDTGFPDSFSPDPEPKPGAGVSHSRASVLQLAVPYVEMLVSYDCVAVDIAEGRDIWIAAVATVHARHFTLPLDRRRPIFTADPWPMGTITSLRLCFKPVGECQVLDVIGQKSLKNLVVGMTCSLFIKVRIYPVSHVGVNSKDINYDQDSLFADLESMIGTVETNVLNVEARYRHSMLPSNSVVTVHCLAKVRRPNAGSRWSQVEDSDANSSVSQVRMQLMAHLNENYSTERATRLIERALGRYITGEEAAPISHGVTAQFAREKASATCCQPPKTASDRANKPTVIVTDIDSVAPSTGAACNTWGRSSTLSCIEKPQAFVLPEHSPRLCGEGNAARQMVASEPAALPMVGPMSLVSMKSRSEDEQDTARALWRHIRRRSLSVTAQLADLAPARLDTEDPKVGELQRQAIANKRSVGAETLRAWKWEGKAIGGSAVAPWL